MSNEIKVPMTIELHAGDVLVAVSEDSALWGFVFGCMVDPPDKSLPPLPVAFLPPGYRTFP